MAPSATQISFSRQGIGAFVATSPTPTLRLDASLRSPDRHQSLFELRAALEVRAAELAALRRTEEDLQAIQRAFDDMERSMDWGKDGVEHDIEFHRAIAGATGNGFMLATIMFIAEHLKESIKLTRTMSDIKEVNAVTLQEHRAILVAIGARDPAAACRIGVVFSKLCAPWWPTGPGSVIQTGTLRLTLVATKSITCG